MRASAHSDIRPFAYDDYGGLDTAGRLGSEEFFPADRIGPPMRRRGRKLLWGIFLILIAFGGTWGLYGHPSTWPVQRWAQFLTKQVSAAYTALERKWSEVQPRSVASTQAPTDQPKPMVLEKPLPSE